MNTGQTEVTLTNASNIDPNKTTNERFLAIDKT